MLANYIYTKYANYALLLIFSLGALVLHRGQFGKPRSKDCGSVSTVKEIFTCGIMLISKVSKSTFSKGFRFVLNFYTMVK